MTWTTPQLTVRRAEFLGAHGLSPLDLLSFGPELVYEMPAKNGKRHVEVPLRIPSGSLREDSKRWYLKHVLPLAYDLDPDTQYRFVLYLPERTRVNYLGSAQAPGEAAIVRGGAPVDLHYFNDAPVYDLIQVDLPRAKVVMEVETIGRTPVDLVLGLGLLEYPEVCGEKGPALVSSKAEKEPSA